MNIFTPGIYHGTPEYNAKQVVDLSLAEVTPLVRLRAMEDGMFCIVNDLVGDDVDKMIGMILSVCDSERITRCYRAASQEERTLDFMCRDLANGSKWPGVPREKN